MHFVFLRLSHHHCIGGFHIFVYFLLRLTKIRKEGHGGIVRRGFILINVDTPRKVEELSADNSALFVLLTLLASTKRVA